MIDRVARDVPPSALSHAGMGASNAMLRARCAALQAHVDALARKWIEGIPGMIFSFESAAEVAAEYDGGWFGRQLWSDDVKADAARAFVAASAPYPTVDTSIWKKISEGK